MYHIAYYNESENNKKMKFFESNPKIAHEDFATYGVLQPTKSNVNDLFVHYLSY